MAGQKNGDSDFRWPNPSDVFRANKIPVAGKINSWSN